MLVQRPSRALIKAARAQINGGTICSAVRQIWAFCEPVIPFRATGWRRRRFRFLDDMPRATSSRCTPGKAGTASVRGGAVEAPPACHAKHPFRESFRAFSPGPAPSNRSRCGSEPISTRNSTDLGEGGGGGEGERRRRGVTECTTGRTGRACAVVPGPLYPVTCQRPQVSHPGGAKSGVAGSPASLEEPEPAQVRDEPISVCGLRAPCPPARGFSDGCRAPAADHGRRAHGTA